MVSQSPNWGYGIPSKWPKWHVDGGDPNYLVTGTILQVGLLSGLFERLWSEQLREETQERQNLHIKTQQQNCGKKNTFLFV